MFIVKVPGINGFGKTKGCEKSGNKIISELRKIQGNESGKLISVDSLDLEEIHLDNSNLELTNKLIYENALETFEVKPKTIFLGGDGSVSFSLTRAFLEYCKQEEKEPCLIVFDAYANCRKSKTGFADNLSWLRELVESGFPGENILLVGTRSLSLEESNFLKEKKIKKVSINTIISDLEDACDGIMEFANGKELYVSLDLCVLDPSFMPSVAFPEPGGLTSRQLIYLLQRLNKVKTLKAIDIVELNPEKQNPELSIKLAAKILAELI